MCLEVQSGYFEPSACGNGALASNIWIYTCANTNSDGEPRQLERTRDCPFHENVIWRLTGNLLRSAVPFGPPSGAGPVAWTTCLTTTAVGGSMTLASCNSTDPRQHWKFVPAGDALLKRIGLTLKVMNFIPIMTNFVPIMTNLKVAAHNASFFQLRQEGKCVSSVTSGPPPAPPPPPVPPMPPVANLSHDQEGAEIVVITSPGKPTNGTAVVLVRGGGYESVPKAVAVRPAEAAPSALATLRMVGGDVVVTVVLIDGAAVAKLTP